MDYDDIHPAMREAVAAFDALRRMGFSSDDIFFHQNADEPPGPEERGMMFVVLQRPEGNFSIRVGVVDSSYTDWQRGWTAVAAAAAEGRIPKVTMDRIWNESAAHRLGGQITLAIARKGIKIPGPSPKERN